MTTGVLVLARLDSRRLPGKVLADLGGRTLLGRVLDRVRLVPDVDRVIVATSDRSVDDPVAAAAGTEAGVSVYRGPGGDVLGRCLAAAEHHGLDVVVRISADSPFVDPGVVAAVMGALRPGVDLATNVHPRTWPPGTSAEALTRDALARLADATDDPDDREHVTRYAYAHPAEFAIANVEAPGGGVGGVSLTVDEPEHLERARAVVAASAAPERLTLDDVIAAWQRA